MVQAGMTSIGAAASLLLTLAGCAAAAATPVEHPQRLADEDRCDAAAPRELIGKPATPEAGARALKLSGAAMLRWIRPGEGVTSDYMTSRLNIDVDARGRIAGFRCG
jgi:hypothetical protein